MFTIRTRATVGVIVAALAIIVAGCGGDPDTTSTSSTVTTTAPPNLTASPAKLTWETWRGVSLPRSGIDGPTQTGNVAPMGYSRSPQGAVLAAIRGQAHLGLASDSEWGKTVALVTAPGPGRDEFATQRITLSISGSVPAETAPRYTGFKITHYGNDTAAVHVLTEIGAPAQRFDYPVALRWIQGDWRIVLPTTAEGVDATEVPNSDGYTRLERP